MSGAYEAIPKEHWQGVGKPTPDITMPCNICGRTDTRILSMGESFRIPPNLYRNENTFMIPNKAWGYIQCAHCELDGARRERQKQRLERLTWGAILAAVLLAAIYLTVML